MAISKIRPSSPISIVSRSDVGGNGKTLGSSVERSQGVALSRRGWPVAGCSGCKGWSPCTSCLLPTLQKKPPPHKLITLTCLACRILSSAPLLRMRARLFLKAHVSALKLAFCLLISSSFSPVPGEMVSKKASHDLKLPHEYIPTFIRCLW